MRGRHHAEPCMDCACHPCLCGGFNYPRSARRHRPDGRPMSDWKMRRKTPLWIRAMAFAIVTFNLAVAGLVVWAVLR